MMKAIYEKPIANIIIFNGERQKDFLLISGTRQRFLLPQFLFKIQLEVRGEAPGRKKLWEIKYIQIGKEEKLSLLVNDVIILVENKYHTQEHEC